MKQKAKKLQCIRVLQKNRTNRCVCVFIKELAHMIKGLTDLNLQDKPAG